MKNGILIEATLRGGLCSREIEHLLSSRLDRSADTLLHVS
jgi:hypothetical protein